MYHFLILVLGNLTLTNTASTTNDVTFFGYCNPTTGDTTAVTPCNTGQELDWVTIGYICPLTGCRDVTELKTQIGTGNIYTEYARLGIYSGGDTLVLEGDTTFSFSEGDSFIWRGYNNAHLIWRNGYTFLTGGDTYFLVAAGSSWFVYIFGSSGLPSGTSKYKTGTYYLTGMPNVLPVETATNYSYKLKIRAGTIQKTQFAYVGKGNLSTIDFGLTSGVGGWSYTGKGNLLITNTGGKELSGINYIGFGKISTTNSGSYIPAYYYSYNSIGNVSVINTAQFVPKYDYSYSSFGNFLITNHVNVENYFYKVFGNFSLTNTATIEYTPSSDYIYYGTGNVSVINSGDYLGYITAEYIGNGKVNIVGSGLGNLEYPYVGKGNIYVTNSVNIQNWFYISKGNFLITNAIRLQYWNYIGNGKYDFTGFGKKIPNYWFFAKGRKRKMKPLDYYKDENGVHPLWFLGNADGDYIIPDRLTITSGGKVGIGTSNPTSHLHVIIGNSVATGIMFTTSDWAYTTTGSGIYIYTGAATGNTYTAIQAMDNGGAGSDPLVLQPSGGNVGIFKTLPGYLIDTETSGGGYYSIADHQWHNGSSERFKTNIKKIEKPLDILSKINGYEYDFDEERGGNHAIGPLAEEIGAAMPFAVGWSKDTPGKADGYGTGHLIGLLIEVVKTQQTQIEDLKNQIAKIQGV